MRPIEEVKAAYELALLELPGVTGVGIGERNGKPAIVIYVKSLLHVLPNLPKELEEHPLVFERLDESTTR